MGKRIAATIAGLGIVVAGVTVAPHLTSAQGATKVEVCHVHDDGGYIKISVADAAYDAHLAHGDASPGDPVPGMASSVFDDDCLPQSSLAKAGCFLITDQTIGGQRYTTYALTTGANPQPLEADEPLFESTCTTQIGVLTAKSLVWATSQSDADLLCQSAGGGSWTLLTATPDLYACYP